MKHCDKCNVDVESNLSNCPLCGAYLKNDDGDKSKNNYAYREVTSHAQSKRVIMKSLLFISLIASIVCLIVDIAVNDKLVWSMHLVTAIVGVWIVLLRPIFAKVKIRVQIYIDMVFAIIMLFYAEYFAKTDNNWAFHIGLPIVFMATLGIYALLMICDHKRWQSYAMTVTPIGVIAIVPIFIALGVFKYIHPLWYVTCGVAVIMLVSFFIFGKQDYISELKKRLHF